jgi:hypothetical protein
MRVCLVEWRGRLGICSTRQGPETMRIHIYCKPTPVSILHRMVYISPREVITACMIEFTRHTISAYQNTRRFFVVYGHPCYIELDVSVFAALGMSKLGTF